MMVFPDKLSGGKEVIEFMMTFMSRPIFLRTSLSLPMA